MVVVVAEGVPPEQVDVSRFKREPEDIFILGMMVFRPQLWLSSVVLVGLSSAAEGVFSLPDGGGFGLFLRRIILTAEGFMGDVMTIILRVCAQVNFEFLLVHKMCAILSAAIQIIILTLELV